MRPAIPVLALLASCASPSADEPEDPAALTRQLDHADPLRREEAAHRLSLLGVTVPGNDDTLGVGDRLAEALQQRDPQKMVWRAYHLLRLGCLGRDWTRLEGDLPRQGFRLIEIYEPHDRAKFVRYVVRRAAYTNDAGDRHDLFFWIQSIRRGNSWIVREVYLGLHARFESSFKSLAAVDRYPRESVLARFFALDELQTLATVFPVLEEIELTYGRIRLKDADGAPAGFQVTAGFAMEAKAGGRTVSYTAECGLDPRETRRGRLAWEGFTPVEAVGPLTRRGAGYWCAGMPRPADD